MSKDASVYFLVVAAYIYKTYLTTPVFFILVYKVILKLPSILH